MPEIFNPAGLAGSLPPGSYQSSLWAPISWAQGSGTLTANSLYLYTVPVLSSCTLTGIQIFNDATISGNILVALFNSTGSSQLAVSASTAHANAFSAQLIPFTSAYAATAGSYLMAFVPSSATATFSITGKVMTPGTITTQGGFTMPSTVTAPTISQRAGVGPTLATY